MANILASEMGKPLEATAGPAIERPGDLVGLLTSLQPETVLFIDEIHRLPPKVEEILYSAMEDFQLDLMIGQGPTARSMRMPLAPFTLVGATTRMDMLTSPLRGRFVIVEYMEYYEEDALQSIIQRAAGILGIKVTASGAAEIARRSRGTPRVANRLLKRVWDFHVYEGIAEVGEKSAGRFLEELGVDERGLDRLDRELLRVILMQYDGGPVGIEALAASLEMDRGTLEDVYEPYLVRREILSRGPRGRSLTHTGRMIAAKYAGVGVQQTLTLGE
jgi:Holliday junction DNA helicase RuvB